MSDLIHKIVGTIIEVGQSDTKKFRLGEIIRYTPSEILEILKQHENEIFGEEPSTQSNDLNVLNALDCISRQAAVDAWKNDFKGYINALNMPKDDYNGIMEYIDEVPSAQPEPQWIPIKWHDCTDEDREKYGFSNDIVAVFDCEMPDDDQPILVTTSHGYVNQDVCYIDDGYSLDSGWDWIDDIKAWMPLPEPFKEE